MDFTADVSRLLDIVANALYTNRDVFLRELISNAADACDRLRYDSIQNPDLIKDDPDFKITVLPSNQDKTVTIIDNGIGMNREDLIENLGTIAKSGTAKIMEQMKQTKDEAERLNLIGQFGVGFYSCFTLSDKVEVVSKKAGDDQAWIWVSDGKTGYEIREASEKEASLINNRRGTAIQVHVKKDAYDYLLEDKLKQVILTYSDHIELPIYVGEEEKPVNTASALWMRSKNDVSEEQYKEFYQTIGNVFDEPLSTIHWRAEGKIEYNGLLFIPSLRPWDMYDPERKHSVRLYVKRVFITDKLDNLVYPWLRFIRGVIDSEDLPLNISREMLQNNPVVDMIRRGMAKKILSEINAIFKNDEAKFKSLWLQFGPVIKEGLYDAVEHREDIFKICRFHSTNKDNEFCSLEDYVARMKPDQEHIYYLSGENLSSLKNSPQLEGFKARGIEVLFFTDTVDDFWLQMIPDYQGKKFQSITKGDVDLSKFEKEGKEQEGKKDNDQKDLSDLLVSLKEILKDHVEDVRLSRRLTESPVCLVAPDNAVDMHMERVLKIHQKYESQTKPVLEINGNHPLIGKLNDVTSEDDKQDAAWLLLEQARIIQGEPVSDPSAFARRLSSFMQRGLG